MSVWSVVVALMVARATLKETETTYHFRLKHIVRGADLE